MPSHAVVLVGNQMDIVWGTERLQKLLNDGWVINPDARPHSGDGFVVYCMVTYTDDEVKEMAAKLEESKPNPMSDVDSIISVPINNADAKLAEGYEVWKDYAKDVTLIRRGRKTDQPKVEAGKFMGVEKVTGEGKEV